MPRLCKLYPGICLTTEEKHGITSVRAAEKLPVATPKITGVVDQLDWLPEELYCSGFRDVCIFFLKDYAEYFKTYESSAMPFVEAAQTALLVGPVYAVTNQFML